MLGAAPYLVLRRSLSWQSGEAVVSLGSTFAVVGTVQPLVDRDAAPSEQGASSSRRWRFYVADGEPALQDSTSGVADRVFVNGRWVEVRAVEDWHGSRAPGFSLGHARYVLVEPVRPGPSEADELPLACDDFEGRWA
jgi:hypothetical protein